jgi:hypothetical protein
MSTTGELAIAPKESEGKGKSNAFSAPAQETATEQDSGVPSRAFGGAAGEPSGSRAAHFLGSPSLSHPVNSPARVVALKRAQQSYGNRFIQRFIQRTLRQDPAAERGDNHVIPEGNGQPMDSDTRRFAENNFGRNLGDVRVHTDSQAGASADALQADAFTTGRDIYFAPGRYAPSTAEGRHLLIHEITHVIQQADGRTSAPGVARKPKDPIAVQPQDGPLEKEAEAVADKVANPKVAAPKAVSPKVEPKPEEKPSVPAPSAKSTSNGATKPTDKTKPSSQAAAKGSPATAKGPPKPGPSQTSAKSGGTTEAPGPVTPVLIPPALATPPLLLTPPLDVVSPTKLPPEQANSVLKKGYDPIAAAGEVETLLAGFRSVAESRKNTLRQAAKGTRSQIATSGETQKKAIRAQVSEDLATIKTGIAKTRKALTADAIKVKISATLATTTGFVSLLLKTAEHVKAVDASAQAHKKKASEAVTKQKEAIRKFGVDEGNRGKKAMDQQATDASAKGRAKAAGYPADERGQLQAQAALKVAADVSAKMAEPGPDLQSSLVEGGEDLADGIGDADASVAKGIDDSAPGIKEEIHGKARELGKQFGSIRTDVNKGVDDFVTETNQKLDEIQRMAVKELRALEAKILAQITASVTQLQTMVDSETQAAVTSIDNLVVQTEAGARKLKQPYVEGVRQSLVKAQETVDRTADQFVGGLEGLADASRNEFAASGTAIKAGIKTIADHVDGSLTEVKSSISKAMETFAKKAQEGSDKINEEWTKSLAGAQKEIDKKYDEAITGMEKEIQKGLAGGKAKLTAQVNEAIAKNREPLALLDTKMEEAAKEARDKYDAPWYEKVGRWLLHALASFLKALGMLLLIVLAVIVAIVLIIAGIVFDLVILIVIGIALLVAAVIYVLYGIVKGWIDRVLSAETWWQAAWAGIVGLLDIVGIPGVIEGIIQHDIVNGRKLTEEEAGDRFGSGLLGLLLFLLPLKAKGAKAPGGAPRVPVEIPAEPLPRVPVEPIPKPIEPPVRPVEPPVPGPVEPPPVPKPVEPPAPKPVEPPGTTPVEPPGTTPVEPPAPKPVEPPIPKPVEPPGPKPVEPGPKPGEPPGSEPKTEPGPSETKPVEPKPGETGGEVNLEDQHLDDLQESKVPGEAEVDPAICFPVGTPVSTPEGLRQIESIRAGELVYAFDFDSNTVAARKVTGLTRGATSNWVAIHVGQEVIRATGAHPFWVEELGEWVRAMELTAGVKLRLQDGQLVEVRSVEFFALNAKEATFNLSIEEAENFFVGNLRVLVHNITKARIKHLSRPGYQNYVLRAGGKNGKIYYSGMFGPGETVANVKYRHSNNHNRFKEAKGDYFDLQPGIREYGEARIMEDALAVNNTTIIGRKGKNYRGNRQRPLAQEKQVEYSQYEQWKQGCG